MATEKSLLTTAQVADMFEVTPSAVVKWADKGLLPFHRTPGKHRRFRREDVERLLESGVAS
jgi:excisionase family DNA binding protein